MKFTVTKTTAGQRLDKCLTARMKTTSRSAVQKLIDDGRVLVDGKTTSAHYQLKIGEKIIVSDAPSIVATNTAVTPAPEPRVIAEQADFLIIEKPAGLLVHPTEKNEPDTLVSWLVKHYPAIAQVGEQQYRAGIIHRLDRDVSGVMVVPKNNEMFFLLKEQFKRREVAKEYQALVYGHPQDLEGTIELPIGRRKDGKFVAHPRHGQLKLQEKDKIAKTHYEVLEYIKDYSLLKVTIATGRTHQIRVHLSAIGHPILGDRLYKAKNKFFHFLRRRIKVVDPGRIFLHSTSLGFYDRHQVWQMFAAPLPPALTEFLNGLKR